MGCECSDERRQHGGDKATRFGCKPMRFRLAHGLAWRPLVLGCALLSLVGCATGPGDGVEMRQAVGLGAGAAGAVMMASELAMLTPEYQAGVLIAYAIYDPLAPNWTISARRVDEEIWRIDLKMKRLVTGGEGEASRIFRRSARQIAEASGAREFEVLRYEEGVESTRPFAQRFATGDIRPVAMR